MSRVPSIGLSAAEAAVRLKSDGFNELPVAARRGVLRILFEVIRQPMFALLIAGGIVYLLLGDRMEAILLLIFAGVKDQSHADELITKRIAAALALIDVRVLDHCIVAGAEVLSFAE